MDRSFVFAPTSGRKGRNWSLLFSVQRLDLLDQCVDLCRCQLAAEFGHAELGNVSFAVCNGVAQFFGRDAWDFGGDERRPGEPMALGSLSVALCAILLIHGIRGEACVRRRNLAEDCYGCEKQE